jgi:CRP-like cAMP-binding protein
MEEKIAKCSLFKNISKDEIQALLNPTRYKTKKYSKDSIIIFQNDVCVDLIILYSGRAVAEKINYSGKIMVVEEFTAPKVLAPAFLYIKNNYYPVSVYAMESCELIMIPRKDFMSILQKNSQILFNFLEIISEQTYFLNEKLNVMKLSLKGKIAKYLLNQKQIKGKDIIEIPSHQRLAEIFSVARPSLTRSLSEMQADKMISIANKKVHILSTPALRNLAE